MSIFLSVSLGLLLNIAQQQTVEVIPVVENANSTPAHYTDPFKDPLIIEIQALHTKSEKGDKKATKALIKRLHGLLKKHPKNHLLTAYLGSAYTLASRDAAWGPSKYNHLKTGLKTMDIAVKKDPDNMAVRFVRAINNFHLPAIINRRDNARADFEKLVQQLEKNESQNKLNNETKQAIYYYAGLSFKQLKKKNKAKKTWEKGITLDNTSDLSKKISKELKTLKI